MASGANMYSVLLISVIKVVTAIILLIISRLPKGKAPKQVTKVYHLSLKWGKFSCKIKIKNQKKS